MLNGQNLIFVGRLGKDPVLKSTSKGAVCELSVATRGKLEGEVVWHQTSVWGTQAKYCKEMLKKGSQIFVEGVNKINNFTNSQGEEVSRPQVTAKLIGIVPA